MKCQYCNKEFKDLISLKPHEIRCFLNPNKIETKRNQETKDKISKSMKINHSNTGRIWKEETLKKLKISTTKFNEIYWTDEKRKEQSERMSKIAKEKPNSYSINNVSGRAKIYEYNGFKLKGTWELDVAKFLDKENIKWTNKTNPFPYFWNEKWHLYFPDFYLPDFNMYIEVKGYERERDLEKWKSVKKLIILKEKEIEMLRENKSNIKQYIAGE